MQLVVNRFYGTKDFTLGLLLEDTWIGPTTASSDINVFAKKYHKQDGLCFTLEDAYQDTKIPGKTRIPAGNYEIKLRPEGGKYQKYLTRFGTWQKPGMLHITNVPGFEWILIHPGNTNEDTEGCLLVGSTADMIGNITNSVSTYTALYKKVSERLLAGEKCFIRYEDNDR